MATGVLPIARHARILNLKVPKLGQDGQLIPVGVWGLEEAGVGWSLRVEGLVTPVGFQAKLPNSACVTGILETLGRKG